MLEKGISFPFQCVCVCVCERERESMLNNRSRAHSISLLLMGLVSYVKRVFPFPFGVCVRVCERESMLEKGVSCPVQCVCVCV